MNYRRFGRTGWKVSEIGYGMWGMGEWPDSDDEQSLRSLRRSVELGCNFFDTALAYGDGHSERLLGTLVRDEPDKTFYTASKVPPKNREWPSRRHVTLEEVFPPDYVEASVVQSLKNTGLNQLDLMQLHVWEDGWLDDDRWFGKLDDLRRQGLIQAIGISLNRWEPWNGVEAVRSGLVDAVQVIYNVFDQAPEDELFPACREMDVAVVARVPFDEGTLTGTLTKDATWPDGDWRNTYFVPENLIPSVERAERLKPLVRDGMDMPEMALRFVLSNDLVATVIPGMRKLRHVEANMGASEKGPLDAGLLEQIRDHRWDREPTDWSQ
jgi:aryl-alcohol dehydrogenase-like predicted oxidoreductase